MEGRVDAHNGGMVGLYGSTVVLVADSHHFDEEQDPDPDLREKLDPYLHLNEKRDRIRTAVMRTAFCPTHI
jgi:hypothetical protein